MANHLLLAILAALLCAINRCQAFNMIRSTRYKITWKAVQVSSMTKLFVSTEAPPSTRADNIEESSAESNESIGMINNNNNNNNNNNIVSDVNNKEIEDHYNGIHNDLSRDSHIPSLNMVDFEEEGMLPFGKKLWDFIWKAAMMDDASVSSSGEEKKNEKIQINPGFSPIPMTIWQPLDDEKRAPPGFFDHSKILLNNAMQLTGFAESLDGAPLVQGVNTYKGNPLQLLSRVLDGDLAEIAGGPLFLLLQGYYKQYGSVYKLAFGPKSFMIVSDPVLIKHILKDNSQNYDKGILAEILEPIMGKGLIPADPETWKVRRKAIVPGFHKAWLNAMMSLFVNCNRPLIKKLDDASKSGEVLNMETEFCSVSLDIIGKAVFNYDFGSVTQESPVVKAVYRALQEAEHRSTSFIPYWNIPFANHFMPNLRSFEKNMALLNNVLDELIVKALDTQSQADVEELENRDYSKMENPSLLRFLVDMRGEDTTSTQLRDDLMTMLIAGHETTAAVLTWTFYELSQKPEIMAKVRKEIDDVLGDRDPTFEDMANLPFTRLCLAETLRMYPEPPLLIRRALEDDVLPRGGAADTTFITRGTDIFISTFNMHRSADYWEDPETYNPDRFTKPFSNPKRPDWKGYNPGGTSQLYPNEVHSDFAFMPFGGGSRKCVGDQFAMMEATATVALIIKNFDLVLVDPNVGMRTGATIHTEKGLLCRVTRRSKQ